MVLFFELLDVFRCRSAGAGLKESAAVHERDNREHLGTGTDFENREEVGEVITQDVAGDGDGVVAATDSLEAESACIGGGEDSKVEAFGVVVGEVRLNLPDQVRVVSTVCIEPEDCRRPAIPGAADCQLHPVPDRRVFGLAHPPDVPGLDLVGDEDVTVGPHNPHGTRGRDLKRLVVRSVLLGLLRHQADVRDTSHRRRVKRPVGDAVVDHRLVHAGVGAVGDHRLGVFQFARGVPHFAGVANQHGHRGVNDHVAGDVKIGNAVVGIDLGDPGTRLVYRLQVGFDRGAVRLGK